MYFKTSRSNHAFFLGPYGTIFCSHATQTNILLDTNRISITVIDFDQFTMYVIVYRKLDFKIDVQSVDQSKTDIREQKWL